MVRNVTFKITKLLRTCLQPVTNGAGHDAPMSCPTQSTPLALA